MFVPGSRVTFAEYAAHSIETLPLNEQTRYRYRSILNALLGQHIEVSPGRVERLMRSTGRRHSTLGYLSPADYEQQHRAGRPTDTAA